MSVAVVTGAGSGMGRLCATRLAAAGTVVAAIDRDAGALADLAVGRPTIHPFEGDVTDAEGVEKLAAEIEDQLGPIDRLVTAAGIGVGGRIGEVPVEQFHRVMDVNYFGTVHWVDAVLPPMRQRHRGELVIFASLAGWVSSPGMSAYCATKFATVAFTEALAEEVRGAGIRVLCVCPPSVETPLLHDLVDGGAVPKSAIRRFKPITPEVVVDAIDAALPGKGLWVFPGRGSTALWRVRRHTPRLAAGLFRRLVKD